MWDVTYEGPKDWRTREVAELSPRPSSLRLAAGHCACAGGSAPAPRVRWGERHHEQHTRVTMVKLQ